MWLFQTVVFSDKCFERIKMNMDTSTIRLILDIVYQLLNSNFYSFNKIVDVCMRIV